MPVAMVIGVAGQDGSYLAELLLEKGYRVIGTVPPGDPGPMDNLRAVLGRVEIQATDLMDPGNLVEAIGGQRPDEIYNLASQSHLLTALDDPLLTGETAGLGVARILEAIRTASPSSRFFQASSSEMFGRRPGEAPQTEETPFDPWNAYAAAKLYAHTIVGIYRRSHALFACSGILYNHESPRRRQEFVTRKVTRGAASIRLGLARELRLGRLDARRDWGYAGDFVRGMWLMLQQDTPDDYILSTGVTHSVRDLCEAAFSCVGLDYRDYVVADSADPRHAEEGSLVGNPAKAKRVLGWEPAVPFRELVRRMVDEDLDRLRSASRQ